jgi:hypothetical protein
MRRGLTRLATLTLAVTLAACGGSDGSGGAESETKSAVQVPLWPAPRDPLARTRAAGLEPERKEFVATHRHAHLDVFSEGRPVLIPAGIGIDITDPGVKRGDGPSYGGIEMCDRPCISPLHTHDTSGTLHTESKSDELNTLGQFFVEWGVRLDQRCVGEYCPPATKIAVYIDGERFTGDPREIELVDGREIAIVIGAPPAVIPSRA